MSQRIKDRINRIDYGLFIAIIIPIVAIMPLLTHPGLPNTADGPVHLMRQVELNQAWAEGNFYPRWGTDLALGHGMPIFSYAPPALYQLTQLFHLTGLPLDESMKAVLVLGFILYSVGMFLFARRVYGTYPALLAAALYVYAPYRLREAYIQGNYGQFTGLAFYPLIFWGFHGLITDGRPRYWLAAAVSLAGLLFSHNISFMIFAPLLAVYLLFLLILDTWQRLQAGGTDLKPSGFTPHVSRFIRLLLPALVRTVAAGLLGLGLAAIFWLPAFGERHDIKLEGITQGFFDFRENFIKLPDLLSPPLPLDLAAINPEFPLSLGLPQIIGTGAGIIALIYMTLKLIAQRKQTDPQTVSPSSPTTTHHPEKNHSQAPQFTFYNLRFTHAYLHTIFFAAFLLLYAFLTLPQSQTVWENAPLIELAEFPWRMLGPAIFCAGVLSAATLFVISFLFLPLPVHSKRNAPTAEGPHNKRLFIVHYSLFIVHYSLFIIHYSLFIVPLFIVIALNAYYLYPSQFIPWGTPTPTDAFAYEAASGAIGTTSTGEFLPRWAQQHPQPETLWPDYEANQPPQKLDPGTFPGGATTKFISHRAQADTWQINTPQPFVATLRTLYWPGWQVYLNDKPVPLKITPNTGLIRVDIPAGRHTLHLQLESTPLRSIGLWLTLLAVIITGGIAVLAISRKLKSRSEPLSGKTAGLNHQLPNSISLIVITILLSGIYLFSRPLSPFFVLQSDPNQPQPADRNLLVDFADQIRLVGVDLWPREVELPAEGSVDLRPVLYWKAQQNLDINYSIFLHLDTPNGQTLATVDEVNPEDIPTRNWPPGLYLRNPLHLRIPAELPPIRYDITTGVYNRDTGQRLPLVSGEGTSFKIGPVWLTEPQPRSIPAAIAFLIRISACIKPA